MGEQEAKLVWCDLTGPWSPSDVCQVMGGWSSHGHGRRGADSEPEQVVRELVDCVEVLSIGLSYTGENRPLGKAGACPVHGRDV